MTKRTQILRIPGPLPGMNEILDAKATFKGKWNKYGAMKKAWQETIGMFARAQHFQPFTKGHFHYRIWEPHRRRDPSNIFAGAMKIIEDALQEAKLMPNDGWGNVLGVSFELAVNKSAPAIELVVTIEEE